MTVSNSIRKAGPYAGTGAIVALPFSFKVFSASDLVVTKADSTGAETTLVLTTDYTVSLNADQDASPGGAVTPVSAPDVGTTLTLSSDVTPSQTSSIPNGGGFYPKVVENALDKLTVLYQQELEKVSRSLKLAISTPSGVNPQLPAPVPYQLIGWNADGTGFQNTDPTYSTALATDLASTAAGKGVALVGGAARWVDSISSLRALPKTGSARAFVAGYYAPGDGGGGAYYYDSTDTTSSDNGGTVIVASDGARWKLIHNGEVTVKQFGAKGDGTTDDTVAIQSCITVAHGSKLAIKAPSGTYKITAPLSKPAAFTCPNIVGDGYKTTVIKAYGFAADTSILLLTGGSGQSAGTVISGINFDSDNGLANGVEIDGQCGVTLRDCGFGTLAIGLLPHNKSSGAFTEYCVADNCLFGSACAEALVYRRTGGSDSFHGTGLRGCRVNESASAITAKIRIGGTGSTSNAIHVYNAPLSLQVWKNTTTRVIENNTTYYTTVFHGDITLELFSGAIGSAWGICTGTNCTYLVGHMINGTSDVTMPGKLLLCESFETRADGSVNRWRKPYRVPSALMVPGANTIASFSAIDGESYLVRVVFTSNASPWKYVYLLAVYCSQDINTVTTLATLGSYYAGDNAQPAFSMSGGNLVATQAGWASNKIYCEMSITQIASCNRFQL